MACRGSSSGAMVVVDADTVVEVVVVLVLVATEVVVDGIWVEGVVPGGNGTLVDVLVDVEEVVVVVSGATVVEEEVVVVGGRLVVLGRTVVLV